MINHFIFKGRIPHNEVPSFINASDVCVALKKELKSGFLALEVYEYLACGKPVFATRTSGFEILEKCGAGMLVNPEDSQETAEALIGLLSHDELRRKMGKDGRDLVIKEYSWDVVAKRIAAVCKDAKCGSVDRFSAWRSIEYLCTQTLTECDSLYRMR